MVQRFFSTNALIPEMKYSLIFRMKTPSTSISKLSLVVFSKIKIILSISTSKIGRTTSLLLAMRSCIVLFILSVLEYDLFHKKNHVKSIILHILNKNIVISRTLYIKINMNSVRPALMIQNQIFLNYFELKIKKIADSKIICLLSHCFHCF